MAFVHQRKLFLKGDSTVRHVSQKTAFPRSTLRYMTTFAILILFALLTQRHQSVSNGEVKEASDSYVKGKPDTYTSVER